MMTIIIMNIISSTTNDNDCSNHTPRIELTMTAILVSMIALLIALVQIQTRKDKGALLLVSSSNDDDSNNADDNIADTKSTNTFSLNNVLLSYVLSSSLLPCPKRQPSKRSYEIYSLCYTPIWIGVFGLVVVFELYEDLDAFGYDALCIGLALPYLVQPFVLGYLGLVVSNDCNNSSGAHNNCSSNPDASRRVWDRYCTKANVWLAVYSFIGNYWYTHYFYSVLKAEYTMPAHRLNNVPIALYFATHFYFSTYHVFSNMFLRWVVTNFESGVARHVLFWAVVVCFSYFTAFMETLTISSYPYYSFEDRNMAYTVGSAFYAIYFLVSFPMFFYFDDEIDNSNPEASSLYDLHTHRNTSKNISYNKTITVWDTIVHSCGAGMIIMCLLDFVRLYIGVTLIVGE